MFGRVTVPFHDGPEVYHRPFFGCSVEKSDRFEVLLCTGTTLVNPSL